MAEPFSGAVRPGMVPSPAPAPQPGMTKPMPGTQTQTSDAKRLRYLELLRPKAKVAGEKRRLMPVVILIEGNKGIKTVGALAVKLQAGLSADGKTPILDAPGFPVPEGPVSIISFDHQTEASIEKHYGETQPAVNAVDVVAVRRLLGYNAGKTETAADVIEGTRALLQEWGLPGNQRAMLVVDRQDLFTEDILRKLCHYRANKPIDMKLDRGDWTIRGSIIEEFMDLYIGATMDGGAIIFTGPEDKNEGEAKLTEVNGKWVMAAVPSKWAGRIEHHANARIVGTVGTPLKGGSEQIRIAETLYSRIPWLPANVKAAINGRNLSAFLVPEAHLKPPTGDEPPTKQQMVTMR